MTVKATPDAVASLRDRARARFEALGFPTTRDEEWRQTSVSAIAKAAFAATPSAPIATTELQATGLFPGPGARVVLVDGRLDQERTDLSALVGVSVRPIAEAPEDLLGAVAPWENRPFAAWNTSAFDEGVFVDVAPGARVSAPIDVVHVATSGPKPRATHPRVAIRLGDGAEADVIETFLSLGDGETLTNAVTEIALGPNAKLDHQKIQAEAAQSWHVATLQARQARDSRFHSHNVSFGAAVVRNDVGAVLDGENAECHLYGLTLADGRQVVDNHTTLDHAKPHCPSWEMYKAILAGQARSIFNGRILVRQDAQKTDAKQSNRNLILSREALAFTRPQLEIYANDVKCTHGATIGRLDEEQLFYLRSRGIRRAEAHELLIHAFAAEVLDKIDRSDVRERIVAKMERRLPHLTGSCDRCAYGRV
ncbi:MAG TPA: Fe-S cluster assembly protein SufD [Candidatus Polarisedimenticolaceae bacterium]